jgi:hypothetical protein
VAILASGCSSSSGEPSTGDGGACTASSAPSAGCDGTCDPCSLLTAAQVSAAVGHQVGPGSNTGDAHVCLWHYQSSVNGILVQLTTNIDDATFQSLCSESGNGIVNTPVTGVGDHACSNNADGLSATLNFEKNCWGYSVVITESGNLNFPYSTAVAEEKTLGIEATAKY